MRCEAIGKTSRLNAVLSQLNKTMAISSMKLITILLKCLNNPKYPVFFLLTILSFSRPFIESYPSVCIPNFNTYFKCTGNFFKDAPFLFVP